MNKEQVKTNLTIILTLEYLGVRFEETKEESGPYGLTSRTAYYYSVPESSTLEVEDKELNEKIKTADGLKHFAKEMLVDIMIDSCKAEFGEDAEDFITDVKNNISDYFKFYAKVRAGEVWNKDLAVQRIKDLNKEFEAASGYQEI